MKKRIAGYALLVTLIAWMIHAKGLSYTINSLLFYYTLYLIVSGTSMFFMSWLPRYLRVKRFQREHPGLLYLVLLREQLTKDTTP